MAFDGIFLSKIKEEIAACTDSRVDRIHQPAREELILTLRARGGARRLLLSANASSPRVHFTEHAPENPQNPPMFCMLLRKKLSGARLAAVRQHHLDRILFLDFEATNELGDPVVLTLSAEIMGRHSNLILSEGGRIVDAIKRVDVTTSSVRQVLPGLAYTLPPQSGKLNLAAASPREALARIAESGSLPLAKAVLNTVEGVSPLVAREIAYDAALGREATFDTLTAEERLRLERGLGRIRRVLEGQGQPTMLLDASGKPMEFTFFEVKQYGSQARCVPYESYSALADAFFAGRDIMERMKQRSADLHKLLNITCERVARKLQAQLEDLKRCQDREELKRKGDLISANLYQLQKGDRAARVVDFYSEDQREVEIPLDPRYTPAQNAARYYNEYKKADTAEKKLRELIASGRQELEYLDSVQDVLARAETNAELSAIREELTQAGYLRPVRGARGMKPQRLGPLEFRSSDGYTIYCGRNNLQNERLTLRESRNYDLWLHVQKIPGSHTVVVSQGGPIPERTIEEAAVIAAYHSKARNSSKVPVDYVIIKNVKKIPGAKPGMVTYQGYQTAIVDPDEQLVERLAVTSQGGKRE